jgi:hypothetical protein
MKPGDKIPLNLCLRVRKIDDEKIVFSFEAPSEIVDSPETYPIGYAFEIAMNEEVAPLVKSGTFPIDGLQHAAYSILAKHFYETRTSPDVEQTFEVDHPGSVLRAVPDDTDPFSETGEHPAAEIPKA